MIIEITIKGTLKEVESFLKIKSAKTLPEDSEATLKKKLNFPVQLIATSIESGFLKGGSPVYTFIFNGRK